MLIEPNPQFFEHIILTRRNAFVMNSCLNTVRKSGKVIFKPFGVFGGIGNKMEEGHLEYLRQKRFDTDKSIIVQCFTLYSILLALGKTEVDYLSLDVEGPELEILHTIPFNKIKINVMSIEYKITGEPRKQLEKLEKIRGFFKSVGNYTEMSVVPWHRFAIKRKMNYVHLM